MGTMSVRMILRVAVACGLPVFLSIAFTRAWSGGQEKKPTRALPIGFPAVPVPEDNPLTAAKVVLGETLFFDTRLSSDGTVSCGSCHTPETAFTTKAAFSAGVSGQATDRNTPTLLNVAYVPRLFWDGRSPSLEDQVRYPIVHPREMNMNQKKVVEALSRIPAYAPLFEAAYGDAAITFPRVSQALAAYQRTLIAGDSPFDRFFFAGRPDAISDAARRGWELFKGKARCTSCHTFDKERPFFSDFLFHNTGVGSDAATLDLGRYHMTKEKEDRGRFRTPSLRNVSLTPPYMHDGRFATLEEVLAFYEKGGLANNNLDAELKAVQLTASERADLIAFLHSLTSEVTFQKETNRSAQNVRP
jgi:cytochrome c peroxidase